MSHPGAIKTERDAYTHGSLILPKGGGGAAQTPTENRERLRVGRTKGRGLSRHTGMRLFQRGT